MRGLSWEEGRREGGGQQQDRANGAAFLSSMQPQVLLWRPCSQWGDRDVPRAVPQSLCVLTTASCTGLYIVSSPTHCTLEGTHVPSVSRNAHLTGTEEKPMAEVEAHQTSMATCLVGSLSK